MNRVKVLKQEILPKIINNPKIPLEMFGQRRRRRRSYKIKEKLFPLMERDRKFEKLMYSFSSKFNIKRKSSQIC